MCPLRTNILLFDICPLALVRGQVPPPLPLIHCRSVHSTPCGTVMGESPWGWVSLCYWMLFPYHSPCRKMLTSVKGHLRCHCRLGELYSLSLRQQHVPGFNYKPHRRHHFYQSTIAYCHGTSRWLID